MEDEDSLKPRAWIMGALVMNYSILSSVGRGVMWKRVFFVGAKFSISNQLSKFSKWWNFKIVMKLKKNSHLAIKVVLSSLTSELLFMWGKMDGDISKGVVVFFLSNNAMGRK